MERPINTDTPGTAGAPTPTPLDAAALDENAIRKLILAHLREESWQGRVTLIDTNSGPVIQAVAWSLAPMLAKHFLAAVAELAHAVECEASAERELDAAERQLAELQEAVRDYLVDRYSPDAYEMDFRHHYKDLDRLVAIRPAAADDTGESGRPTPPVHRRVVGRGVESIAIPPGYTNTRPAAADTETTDDR